jgi:putative flavoprotein involved in K+ transport
MRRRPRVLVIGAGAAGLGTASAVKATGGDVTVIERSSAVAASWRTRYDGLRLNTAGWMSGLPGYRARRREYGEFPTRDEWIRYLEDYRTRMGIAVEFGVDATRVDRDNNRWIISCADAERSTDVVVIATGSDQIPWFPDWPGSESFTRDLIHAAEYRSADPYRGRDVLVVGPNVSGSEIAYLIADGGAARVRVAVRTPPNFITRKLFGVSANVPGVALQHLPATVGDTVGRVAWWPRFRGLAEYGLPRSPEGVATTMARRQQAAAYDSGFVGAVRDRRIEIVPAVVAFDGADVVLADDTRIQPDAVIAATGYRRGLESLVGHLGVLDDEGRPLVGGGRTHHSAPNLYFNGFRANLTGMLRLMRYDARSIARAVKRAPGSRR